MCRNNCHVQGYSEALQLLLDHGALPCAGILRGVVAVAGPWRAHEAAMCRDIERHCSCCWTMARS